MKKTAQNYLKKYIYRNVRIERLTNFITLLGVVKKYEEETGTTKLDMATYQFNEKLTAFKKTFDTALHDCGTTCCMAGWLAVSPDFKKEGGIVDRHGGPEFYSSIGNAEAVSNFLGIPEVIVIPIIFTEVALFGYAPATIEQVIEILQFILELAKDHQTVKV